MPIDLDRRRLSYQLNGAQFAQEMLGFDPDDKQALVLNARGRGILNSHGCVVSIEHQKGDRRVFIQADTISSNGAGSGAAFINIFGVSSCQISDRSLTNNTCSCN